MSTIEAQRKSETYAFGWMHIVLRAAPHRGALSMWVNPLLACHKGDGVRNLVFPSGH